MPHILIVEDEAIIRGSIKRLLSKSGYQVTDADSVQSALELGDISRFDLILSDLRMPGALGTDLIQYAESTPVLIMTSYASMKTAVDTLKAGAVDYIAKPFSNQDLLASIAKNIRADETKDSPAKTSNTPHHKLIGNSAPMRKLYKQIYKVANTDVTVLVNGETGTGKELIARALHDNSPRANEPMISVNCAAIPDSLIEAELFGHEKGAFTGADSARPGLVAAAHKGSLFLDEIGELPLQAQARLLRVLQEGEVRAIGAVHSKQVDVRIIAATHRDLKQLSSEGKFREDLYFRLNVIQLSIPPLRARNEDKIEIANALLARYSEKYNRKDTTLSSAAQQVIDQYSWPGNVRELENAIQRGLVLSDAGDAISAEDLGIELEQPISIASRVDLETTQNIRLKTNIVDQVEPGADIEDYFQRFVLANQDFMSETELAKRLGVSRKCLWERRQRFGIPRQKATVTTNN